MRLAQCLLLYLYVTKSCRHSYDTVPVDFFDLIRALHHPLSSRTRRAGAVGWAVNQHLTNASKYFTSIVSVFAVASVKLDNHYNHNNNQVRFCCLYDNSLPPLHTSSFFDNFFPSLLLSGQMCFRDWHVLIVLVLLLRSAFNFAWDVKMDWALGHWHNVRWPLLRPMYVRRVYPGLP